MAVFGISGLGTLAIASVAALGLAYVMPGATATAMPQIDAETTQSVEPSGWRLANHASGADCEARPGPRITGGDHALIMDAGCADVLAGLGEAVLWREGRDGSVALADPSGRLVVSFERFEGATLESVAPGDAMLSLTQL